MRTLPPKNRYMRRKGPLWECCVVGGPRCGRGGGYKQILVLMYTLEILLECQMASLPPFMANPPVKPVSPMQDLNLTSKDPYDGTCKHHE